MRGMIKYVLGVVVAAVTVASCSKEDYAFWHPSGQPLEYYPSTLTFSGEADSTVLSFVSNLSGFHVDVRANGEHYCGACYYSGGHQFNDYQPTIENAHDWIVLSGETRYINSVRFENYIQVKVMDNLTGSERVDTLTALVHRWPRDVLIGSYVIRQKAE